MSSTLSSEAETGRAATTPPPVGKTVVGPEKDFALEGLLLFHTLGFALNDQNYGRLTAVCKEWRRIVRILEPPVISQTSRVLRSSREALPEQCVEELLVTSFGMLKDRESVLYRKEDKEENGDKSLSGDWPSIQPQFHLVLLELANRLCNQQNCPQVVFHQTIAFLETVAQEVVDDMAKTVLTHVDSSNVMDVTASLLNRWYAWESLVALIDGILFCLNTQNARGSGVRRNGEPVGPIRDEAKDIMSRGLLGAVTNETLYSDLVDKLQELAPRLMNMRRQELSRNRCLLLKASQAGERASVFLPEPNQDTLESEGTADPVSLVTSTCRMLMGTLKHMLEQDETEEADTQKQEPVGEEKPVVLVAADGTDVVFPLASPLFTDSGMLRLLQLRPGDRIRFCSMDAGCLETLGRLYQLPQPLPVIQTPLVGRNMREVVGDEYGAFLESLPVDTIFQMVHFIKFLELKPLLDLFCAQASFLIKGKSPQEMRALFGRH